MGTLILAAILCAACGTAVAPASNTGASHSTRPPTLHQVPITAPTRASKPLSHGELLTEVDVVCAAVRRGAPVALTVPFTAARVRRYAATAELATRRTVVSLTRLERLGDRRSLATLVSAWTQLQALYGESAHGVRTSRHARAVGAQIAIREQGLTALAQSLGIPACTVAGRLA